jgi:hypothetical protein
LIAERKRKERIIGRKQERSLGKWKSKLFKKNENAGN